MHAFAQSEQAMAEQCPQQKYNQITSAVPIAEKKQKKKQTFVSHNRVF